MAFAAVICTRARSRGSSEVAQVLSYPRRYFPTNKGMRESVWMARKMGRGQAKTASLKGQERGSDNQTDCERASTSGAGTASHVSAEKRRIRAETRPSAEFGPRARSIAAHF
eukprot:3844856-Pleurochrysis_carterae.AAC.2